MSLFDRLWGFFKGLTSKPVERDVTRLPSHDAKDGRAADLTKEVVRTSGELKPHHRRLITRDQRLLPDPSRKAHWGPLGYTARKKVFDASVAGRLFAGTLRTRNRELRTLATDPAQLERYGLPRWEDEATLAAALGLSVNQLRHLSTHRLRERVPHYVAFAIAKRSGGERVIHAPKKRLKAVLRAVHAQLVSKLPVHPAAHGFVKGRSVKTNAEGHVGRAVVVKLDLEDFFPTVTYQRVRGLLVSLGYGYPVAATLAALMTESERQPVELDGEVVHVPVGPRVCVQGAPTSPGLCNAVVRRMDARLSGLAKKLGFTYSRYADDLAFSGDDPKQVDVLIHRATRVIATEGFRVNGKKTRVMRRGAAQRIAGVTVNATLGLSRKERRLLRAAAHREKTSTVDAKEQAVLTGQLAWVQMLNPSQAEALRRRRARAIGPPA
ncbi:MAG: RNA-directed DNA polymerase [Myxococcaceae bacterium]|nr:RNA-directed DNA polymerase [Myxococcaceae bacterium]